MEIHFPNDKRLQLMQGDITRIRVDAIVNAANAALAGGGGVDGAIHRVGGPSLMRELDEIRLRVGRCAPGNAVCTGAGALPAQYVFHAVGPIYHDGHQGEAAELRMCYETCLAMAEERGLRTISFPAISTGAYGYPLREAAGIALHTIAGHLSQPEFGVRNVLLVLFDKGAYDAHAAIAAADFRRSIH